MWQAFKIAFSMYSIIPMPKTNWNQKNMRYAICFFPFVGVAIGAALILWQFLCARLELGVILMSVVSAVIPCVISGGIHLDGFCDTVDALSSHQPQDKKLEILKDSHTGAFAIFGVVIYFLLYAALWSEIKSTMQVASIMAIGFVLARAFSAMALVTQQPAKDSGLLRTFADAAQKRTVKISMMLLILICFAGMLVIKPLTAMLVLIFAMISYIYYVTVARRQFGGITGDIAGYFVTLCEILMLLGAVISEKILRVI